MISLRGGRRAFPRVFIAVMFLCALGVVTGPPVARADPIILHVDRDAGGLADGSSWADAFTTLQDALSVVEDHPGIAYEIWIAEGVYYPDEGAGRTDNDATESFTLHSSPIHLYGGFAGNEASRMARDWQTHVTVLSGDIDQNDTVDAHGVVTTTGHIVGTNAYHVVVVRDTPDPAIGEIVIDGITVSAGLALGTGGTDDEGGGLLCLAIGAGSNCSPAIANVTFIGNRAVAGGAMVNLAEEDGISSPTLSNVVFTGNVADSEGAALANVAGAGISNPTLINVTFTGNVGLHGGAMTNIAAVRGICSPALINVVFTGNEATECAAVMNWVHDGTGNPDLANVTFSGNTAAEFGGAMCNVNIGETGVCEPALTNVVMWGNSAGIEDDQMSNYTATVLISYSNIQGSGGSGNYGGTADWDAALGIDGGGNIDADPHFVSAPDPGDGDWSTPGDNDYGDLRLLADSPALNAGNNAALPADVHDLDGDMDTTEPIPIDIAGADRIQESCVDMGAYEGVAIATRVAALSLRSTTGPVAIATLVGLAVAGGGLKLLRGHRAARLGKRVEARSEQQPEEPDIA